MCVQTKSFCRLWPEAISQNLAVTASAEKNLCSKIILRLSDGDVKPNHGFHAYCVLLDEGGTTRFIRCIITIDN
jgi:hypothetical protein